MTNYKVAVFQCFGCGRQESISYLLVFTGNPPMCCGQPMRQVF